VTSGSLDSAEPFTMSYLVELSVIAPHGQDQIQEDMKNFAEQLKPYPFSSLFRHGDCKLIEKTC
jgi:hypothetical protein